MLLLGKKIYRNWKCSEANFLNRLIMFTLTLLLKSEAYLFLFHITQWLVKVIVLFIQLGIHHKQKKIKKIQKNIKIRFEILYIIYFECTKCFKNEIVLMIL
jgi:hypothetical protein